MDCHNTDQQPDMPGKTLTPLPKALTLLEEMAGRLAEQLGLNESSEKFAAESEASFTSELEAITHDHCRRITAVARRVQFMVSAATDIRTKLSGVARGPKSIDEVAAGERLRATLVEMRTNEDGKV